MSTSKTGNRKHLTLSDRIQIESGLENGLNFTQIATLLHKDSSTISKEVRRHLFHVPHYTSNMQKKRSECEHFPVCEKHHVCGRKDCSHLCVQCRSKRCSMLCKEFTPKICEKLKKPPYICNSCKDLRGCVHDFYFYRAKYADDIYNEIKTTSRNGINQTPESLEQLNRLVSPLIRQGQSLAHIYSSFSDEIPCGIRTLYSYVDQGYLSVINLDLPRKVRYKQRKAKRRPPSDTGYRKGRTYKDFEKYMADHPDTSVVEMDVVEGAGGKSQNVLLTLFFRSCALMLIFLMDADSTENVADVFDWFYDQLGPEIYGKTFPLILTDNGSSFKDPEIFGKMNDQKQLCHIFYCDPMASWQKGRIENNHEFIRRILPKGTAFTKLSQESVTLMANHINNIARASLNGRTPFELAQLLLDRKLLELCNMKSIPADHVILKPSLLKR